MYDVAPASAAAGRARPGAHAHACVCRCARTGRLVRGQPAFQIRTVRI